MAKPRRRSLEHLEQVALIQWWALQHKRFGLPEFALFAIPNGGHRHPAVAGKLKAEGVRAGILDLMLAVPVPGKHGLFIEMKAGKNRPSPEQSAIGAYLQSERYEVVLCYSFAEAMTAILTYLGVRAEPRPFSSIQAYPVRQ